MHTTTSNRRSRSFRALATVSLLATGLALSGCHHVWHHHRHHDHHHGHDKHHDKHHGDHPGDKHHKKGHGKKGH